MTFSEIRSRLAGLEGRTYWRSLEELADTPDFRQYVEREFPAQASEFTDPAGRRTFLKLMGASLALAGVSACTRQPDEKIIPYVRQPEEIIPGRPLFFATSMPHGGFAMPLLAENHMGRPTKLEGNPEHPASLGATDIFGQASVLGLYDPDRSRTIINRGDVKTWSAFLADIQAAISKQRMARGAGIRLLTEPTTSPSLVEQVEKFIASMPGATWHQWDPVFGTVQGGAPAETALYHFDKADVVVSLDADFLGHGAGALRYSKDFAARRRIGTPQDQLNRLYVVEPVPTITGAKADHRLPLKAAEVAGFAGALSAAVGAAGGGGSAPGESAQWVAAIANDLKGHRGRSVVVAGEYQPASVHALARAMNESLGNVGATVSYTPRIAVTPADGVASIAQLVKDMNAGQVELLVILDGNPAFTAPADLDFKGAMAKMSQKGTIVHLGLYHDETAELSHWHIPSAHYLESWGDGLAYDGTVTMIQPLIAPLYDGRQAIEVLAALNGTPGTPPVDMIKDYWSRAFQGQTKKTWTIRDQKGNPYASADQFWRHALHDGFVAGTGVLAGSAGSAGSTGSAGSAGSTGSAAARSAAAAAAAAPATPPPPPAAPAATPTTGFEVVFRPDPTILDGRYANNGWLQELPKPLSKVTWDAVAYIGVKAAEQLGVRATRNGNANNDVLEIKLQGRSLRLPVWVLPGTADDVIAVHFGYGRRKAGRVGTGVGFDAFGLRTTAAPWFGGGATVERTRDSYLVAATQNHFSMEGRNPVRAVDIDDYRANPKQSVLEKGPEGQNPPRTLTLYPAFEFTGNKWGLSIDLNSCTGCSVCMIACVAENNIPVVGKEQVERTREMHWIRVDTYFEGSVDTPATLHQPVPCQQCENAPCELVCPVTATQHSDEGLNDMVYNRCVGTRYCSNNCPYKVRRFNFLLYADFTTPELMAQRNPDVTIRSRGVMEKCTYCVQRINHARIDAKTEGRAIKDGEIQTACQQACPSDAIVFGNLNDPDSKLVKLVKQERNYGLLDDLNTRPRTTYLAAVRNPNPALEKKGSRGD
jgi:molybdopterin-containing oxidoreductase family iron-sulfur binding subunit